MKKFLNQLYNYQSLDYFQAKEVMTNIGKNVYNEHEVASLITVYLMRTITIEELRGFRDALLELSVKINFDDLSVMDIVGTGGDGKNTINISTIACFIVAGAGVKVAKHGNYGASTICGASNVLELLGYKFKNDESKLKNEILETNFTYLHAPLFHPALKHVAQIRKNFGVRTFFNLLGPLVNPLQPEFLLVGVSNNEIARLYRYLFQQSGKRFTIVHNLDGYDEISLTEEAKIITANNEYILNPETLGKRWVFPNDILGGNSVEESAALFLKILKGDGSYAQNAVVIANAAMAIMGMKNLANYNDAYQLAVQSFESGAAYKSFQKLINMQS